MASATPLLRATPSTTTLDTDQLTTFLTTTNLTHKSDLFRKAAALLTGDDTDLSDADHAALLVETTHKWRQPKTLYFVIATNSMAAVVQGWAQSSMNGANLYFPAEFEIDSKSTRDFVIVGLINCAIYLGTAVLGAWLSGPVNDRAGRRGALFTGGLVSLISAAMSGLCVNWQQLLACRFILGTGLGICASTVTVYAAESAPAAIRGGLAVCWQMFVAFGVFVGFVANFAVRGAGDWTWRLQLAMVALPAFPILAMVFGCPESPAWYLKKNGRYDLALRSLTRLRNTELQAARELYASYLQSLSRVETANSTKRPLWKQLVGLVVVPRIRRATVAAYTVMLAQQLCGINIVSFYSSTIFSDAGFSTTGALVASTIFGFVNFLGAFPAVWTMDTLGRRSLLLLTLPFMALTMLATGLSFNIPKESPAHFFLLASLVYVFCAIYSPGMGPVPNTYSAEVFPLSHREVGMSMAVSTTSMWASILSLSFPSVLNALGSAGTFILYGFLNIVALVIVFLFVPETKEKTLDELDEVFSIPQRQFIKYQVTEYLPWIYRRYLLRQTDADLQPLMMDKQYHQLDQEADDE